jgi:hypothetical protein
MDKDISSGVDGGRCDYCFDHIDTVEACLIVDGAIQEG